MKLKEKIRNIALPLLKNNVVIAVDSTRGEIRDFFKKEFDIELDTESIRYDDDKCAAIFAQAEEVGTKYITPLIRINPDLDYATFHSVLAHEVLHYVMFVTNYIDIGYSKDSQEIYCYILEYVIKEFLKDNVD
jgi:hypothetical protein